ncbi:MAG: DUF6702 family protein [Lutimonas sp.]
MKIRILLTFLLLTSFTLTSFGPHKHYISLTQIEYNQSEKAVQITMRFFIDDLEKAVNSRFDQTLALATAEELKNANVYIERYLENKFKLWINGSEMSPDYLGKKYEDDQVFFFLELNEVLKIDMIEVQNSMLMEIYEEQQNYVKLKIGETDKTFILVKANDKEMLKITPIH